MADEEDVKPRKEREPISLVCLIVIVVATIAVVGAYVNDHMINDGNDTEADTGSTVVTDYTLSLYDYYDNGGAIYQTTVESIADSTQWVHSAGYTEATSYSTFSVTIGSGSVLQAFNDALYGAKEGDKIRLAIPLGEGYTASSTTKSASMSGLTTPTSVTMAASEFTTMYSDVTVPSNGAAAAIEKTVLGWSGIATANSDGTVTVTYMPTAGEEYTIVEGSFGTVKASVSTVSGGVITFSLVISNTQAVTDQYSDDLDGFSEIKMIKLNLYNVTAGSDVISGTVYINGLNSDSTEFSYRTLAENYNTVLYYVITVKSVS